MQNSFFGWYFKCQSDTQTLAMIPAVHKSGLKRSCSIQIITKNQSWNIDFPASSFHYTDGNICIAKNRFGKNGIFLAIHTPELLIDGKLRFGHMHPLKYDIMGPFSLLPFLECRHSVQSMWHSVHGRAYINEQEYLFRNAFGYWEGDQGSSFPKEYAWTQCGFQGGSLMLSVANVPIAGYHFRGIIGVVLWKGKEYRMATYMNGSSRFLHLYHLLLTGTVHYFFSATLHKKFMVVSIRRQFALSYDLMLFEPNLNLTLHPAGRCL